MLNCDLDAFISARPLSATVRHMFAQPCDRSLASDLLFLERWEICPVPGSAAALRVSQIRRANPELAAAIRGELAPGYRPWSAACAKGMPD
jgi:hypothetical protein